MTSAERPPAENRPASILGWKRALGAGILLGLALGCAWLAHWTPLLAARLVLAAAAAVLGGLGFRLLGAFSRSRVWGGALRRRMEERFPDAGLPFFSVLVLLTLAAIATGNNLLYLIVSGLLAVLIVSGVASALNLSGMVLRFRMPREVFAGEPAEVQLHLSNVKSFWPAYSLEVSTSEAGSARAARMTMPAAYFPYLARRGSLTAGARIRFARRGRYAATGFVLSTRFPFGLVQKRRRFQPGERERETVVFPAPIPPPAWAGEAVRAGLRDQSRYHGGGRELYRIRPHQPGDSARQVHWKASAKAGDLRFREFTRESTSRLRLRLALDRELSGPDAEAAISLCTGWLLHLAEMAENSNVDWEPWLEFVGEQGVTGGRRTVFWLPSAPVLEHRRAVLEYLAEVDPALSAGPVSENRLDPDAVEILISDPASPVWKPGAIASNRSADGRRSG